MNNIITIIKREYVTRVRTKVFILTSILTPLFFSLLFLLPTYFSMNQKDKDLKIGLIDPTAWISNELNSKKTFKLEHIDNIEKNNIKSLIVDNHLEGVIDVMTDSTSSISIRYFYKNALNKSLMSQIELIVEEKMLACEMKNKGIMDIQNIMDSIKNTTYIESIKVGGNDTNVFYRPISLASGLVIYLLIFLFSAQVMQGVLEEKSSRIVELIITSISPIKFMVGKIIGIAILGITQILIWIAVILVVFNILFSGIDISTVEGIIGQSEKQELIFQTLNSLGQIDFNSIVLSFVAFFIAGYLLYSSIFAVIGATVNDSDAVQQVSTIVTIPLVLAVLILYFDTINSPDSQTSYWLSMIPFTSPIVMMGRIVYGVPFSEILLSISILIITIILTMYMSGKMYQTMILYTGKKINFREIIKLLKL